MPPLGNLGCWGLLFLGAAWLPPRRWQPVAMALLGLGYLGSVDVRSVCWLLALGGGSALWMRLVKPGTRAAGAFIALVVAVLVRQRMTQACWEGLQGPSVFALSFFTLRIIHVLVQWSRGAWPRFPVRGYLTYLAFMPTLKLGPINRFEAYLGDDNRRRWDLELFSEGLERILHGLAKAIILGNWLLDTRLQLWLEAAQLSPWWAAYLRCSLAFLSVYFRFSGASDVAIGLARLAGYRVAENFTWPLGARNLSEFWRRWHMSLSEWVRDYVYTPVMAETRSTYAGILVGMAVLGLWHEASPRYLAWGLYNGLGIAAWHGFQSLKPRLAWRLPGLPASLLARALTLHVVVLGYALTSWPTLAEGWKNLRLLLGWGV